MILFNSQINNGYQALSNFYPSPFVLANETWDSVEHYYQAQKFLPHDAPYARIIKNSNSAKEAKRLGSTSLHVVRKDWEELVEMLVGNVRPHKEAVMLRALLMKFSQDSHCRLVLAATKQEPLVHYTPWGDAYWGDSGNGSGKNRMGELFMETRTILFQSPDATSLAQRALLRDP